MPSDRSISFWIGQLKKMEGYTNEEIAERLGCVVRTIERKLKLIRSLLWSQGDAT